MTDYRINDFGEMMKKNRLVRCKMISVSGKEVMTPIEKVKQSLCRQTLYWPTVIGHTIIFNIQTQIQSLLNLIPKESLTIDDVNECKAAIFEIVKMESKGTSLPVPSVNSRGKGPKREELYRLLWNELEHYIKVYAFTPEHKAVLSCLREIHVKPDSGEHNGNSPHGSSNKKSQNNGTKIKEENEVSWKELDKYNQMSEREKSDLNEAPSKKSRITASSSNTAGEISYGNSGPQSLFNIWKKKLEDEHSKRRPEFAGRICSTGNMAQLYTHMIEKNSENA